MNLLRVYSQSLPSALLLMCACQKKHKTARVAVKFAKRSQKRAPMMIMHAVFFLVSTPACLCVCNSGLVSFPQDYVGETPIHKAARAGSLECISALLIQGAKAE